MAGNAKPEFTLRTGVYPAIHPDLFVGSLEGKVALVTGSGRGIGREIALALASSGAAVAVSGRTRKEVEDTAHDVAKLGRDCIGVVADICVREDLESLVKEVVEKLGEIDILICNAGINTFMPFHMTDSDDWWRQMEVMVKSPTELTRMILPSMQKRNSGIILFTSSRAAAADLPWAAAYSCAKTAITRFAGVLQVELNLLQRDTFGFPANGISVFSIHPGEVKTSLHDTAFPEKTKKEAPYVIEMMATLSKSHPAFQAELAAWTCVYLCSGRAKLLEGRLVDCTRDIDEVTAYVSNLPGPKFGNSCG